MNTSLLNVFHHATDQDLSGVIANRIDIDLGGIFEKAIDEHRALGGEATLLAEASKTSQFGHGPRKVVAIVHDLHAATAKHVARPNEYGETNAVSDLQRLLEINGCSARRLRNSKALT